MHVFVPGYELILHALTTVVHILPADYFVW